MDYLYLLGGIVVVTLICGIAASAGRQKRLKVHLAQIPGFTATQSVIGRNGRSGIAVDEQRRLICLLNLRKPYSHRLVSHHDLLSCELFEDGTTLSSTVRSSQIGGAIVGELLLGPAGLLIGGLSGKRKTSIQVQRIDLRLTVNDVKAPLHEVRFLNSSRKKGSLLHRVAMDDARHWHALIEVLIQQADREIPAVGQVAASPASPADEIRKLSELRDAGVLSLVEFEQQKAKVLGTER